MTEQATASAPSNGELVGRVEPVGRPGWQHRGTWKCVDRGVSDCHWPKLLTELGPLTVLHLGGES